MLDIDIINETIKELEHRDTDFFNCNNLASLYIVRDHYKPEYSNEASKSVTSELSDILPEYTKYKEIKRKYQLKEMTESSVILAMQNVCSEIKQFIQTLYSSTDMKEEREQIHNMLVKLAEMY